MTCDHCKKDKPDVLARLAPLGAEKLDGNYCTARCAEVIPGREWMRASIPADDASAA